METIEDAIKKEPLAFKTARKRNLRQRKTSSSDDEDASGKSAVEDPTEVSSKLAEAKERQRLRNKPNGVNIIGLALGKKITIEDQLSNKDPFSKSGGMVNMHALKSGKVSVKPVDDPYDVGIGTQFSAETNKRDEDEEMMKYIEDQLSKRKGNGSYDEDEHEAALKYMSPEDAALLALPDHLRLGSTQRSEEMLSNQMLNGIPEVDLGIEAKIKNIEATEAAKEKLLQAQKNKADGPSHFVPTNMAVNFVQHNRFNLESAQSKKRAQHQQQLQQQQQQQQQTHNQNAEDQQSQQPSRFEQYQRNAKDRRPGGGPQRNGEKGGAGVKRATDDYHYDKFKKQFRRY